MSERYSRLFTLQENLYLTGSPVVIAAGALLKDTQTGRLFAQLKFQNIGPKGIKAITVHVETLDTVGNSLGEPVTYQYLDLCAGRDIFLGQKMAFSSPRCGHTCLYRIRDGGDFRRQFCLDSRRSDLGAA